jgi:hypothetical protein
MSCILPVCITFFWNGNRLAGVMVSISASSTYIVGSSPGGINPKTITLLCVASPLSRQRYGVRTKTDWLGNKIECTDLTIDRLIDRESDCCLMLGEQLFSYIMMRTSYFR